MASTAVLVDREIDASLAAVCGAYCGACPIYVAWAQQDTPRLQALAQAYHTTVDRLVCAGCRTPAAFCFGGDCEVKACAQHRGVVSCVDCSDYPCNRIRRAQHRSAHMETMSRDAKRLREIGVVAWLREEDARWRCPGCGGAIAVGMDACARCGQRLPSH